VSISEPSVNTILAEILFEKINEWFARIIPEALQTSGSAGRRSPQPDIFLSEVYGVKVCIEAKIGYDNIEEAVRKCKERLEDGLADLCFAVAYSDEVRSATSILDVRRILLSSKLRVKVLPLSGNPIDLGMISLGELTVILDKHNIYDEVVAKDIVEEVASELRKKLDIVSQLDSKVIEKIAKLIEDMFKIHGVEGEEEEEGE